MSLHLTICPLASIVMILVIFINIMEIFLTGTSFLIMAGNILIAIFIVAIANATCFTYRWVSWVVIVYLAISIFGYAIILFNPEMVTADPQLNQMIQADKNMVNEIRNKEKQVFM